VSHPALPAAQSLSRPLRFSFHFSFPAWFRSMFAFSHSFSSSYYRLSPKKSPIFSESFSKIHSNLESSKHFAQRDGISDSRLPEKRRMYPRFQSKIPCRTGKGALLSLLQQDKFCHH
jgi:hypothetical protein